MPRPFVEFLYQGFKLTVFEKLISDYNVCIFHFTQVAPAEKMAAFCLTEPSSGSDAGV